MMTPQPTAGMPPMMGQMPSDEELAECLLEKGLYLDSTMRLIFVFKNDLEEFSPQEGEMKQVRVYHYIIVSTGEISAADNFKIKKAGLSPVEPEAAKGLLGPISRMLNGNLSSIRKQVQLLEVIAEEADKTRCFNG